MASTVKVLENPTELQIEEAANVMARAFEDDILGRSLVGGNKNLLRPLFTALIRAAAIGGAFYVVNDASGNIVCSGVWFPPGKHMMATEEQRNAGWNDFFGALTPELQEWWGRVDEQSDKKWVELVGSEVYNDCWYAAFIGTDPLHQGKGYAGAMIKDVLYRAGRDGKMVLLTTQSDSNAEWYKKFGFKNHDSSIDFSTSQGPLSARFLSWEKLQTE